MFKEPAVFNCQEGINNRLGDFIVCDVLTDLRTDNQGKVKPVETYKDCADKIISIVLKPRIAG